MKHIEHWLCRIMGHTKRLNICRTKAFYSFHIKNKFLLCRYNAYRTFHGTPCFFICINRQMIFTGEDTNSLDMVTVLMCDKDAGKLADIPINLTKQGLHLFSAEAGIY